MGPATETPTPVGPPTDTPAPVEIPTEAAEITQPGWYFEARRETDVAWATLSYPDTFERLGDDWQNVVEKGMVTTDRNGRAELCLGWHIIEESQQCEDDACHIWIYQGSDYHHWCPQLGTSDCSAIGTQSFDECPVDTATLSAIVRGLGTWFSVTYLWDTQVTLVIAGEGTVEVTPVLTLTFEGEVLPLSDLPPEERALRWANMKIAERIMGEPAVWEVASQGGEPRFFYTAPIAKLEELQLAADVPAGGTWLSMDALPALRRELQKTEPLLDKWLEGVREQAESDGVLLAPEARGPSLVGGGEPWEDARVQEAVVSAVDWTVLTEIAFGRSLPVEVSHFDLEEEVLVYGDAREVAYNPEQAKELLAGAGYSDGFEMFLLVQAGDKELIQMAELMLKDLDAVGIQAGIEEVAPAQARDTMIDMITAEMSVLWLGRP